MEGNLEINKTEGNGEEKEMAADRFSILVCKVDSCVQSIFLDCANWSTPPSDEEFKNEWNLFKLLRVDGRGISYADLKQFQIV